MQLTRMPSWLSSSASALVRPSSAVLLTAYLQPLTVGLRRQSASGTVEGDREIQAIQATVRYWPRKHCHMAGSSHAQRLGGAEG